MVKALVTAAASELQLTGERTLPGISRENYWFVRHLVAYRFAAPLTRGKTVIDIGCGEGYGPAMLARGASQVVGVDIAPEVIEHAKKRYPAENLEFKVMDVGKLEADSDCFDLAVSFQVVEHLAGESGYFEEIERVLKPGGTALFTTPNRLTISPGSDKPINPFHLREYTADDLHSLLSRFFSSVEILGVFHARWLKLNEKLRLVDFIKVYEMGRMNPRYWSHRLLSPLVRASDFRVGAGDLDACLDILAVCLKRPSTGGMGG